MADTLSLKIIVDAKEAERLMTKLTSKFKESQTAVEKATKGMKEFGNSKKEIDKAAKAAENAKREFESMVGTAVRGVGGSLKTAFSSTVSVMGSMLKITGLISTALGGLSVAKISSDYMEFSAQVGVLNGTLRGTSKQVQMLEGEFLKISAATAINPTEIARGYTQLISTTEYGLSKYQDALGNITDMAGFQKQLEINRAIMERAGKVAKSTGTEFYDVALAIMKMPGSFGLPMNSVEDIDKMFDKLVATLHISQGELKTLLPEFAKFGSTLKTAGFNVNESLAAFSALTTVFDTSEAGTRAVALGRFITGATDTIDRVKKETGEDIRGFFYTKDGAQKDRVEILKSVNAWIGGASTFEKQMIRASAVFGEIREQSAVQVLGQGRVLDTMVEGIKELGKAEKEAAGSYWKADWENSLKSIGMKWQLFKAQVISGSMAMAAGGFQVISAILRDGKADVTDFTNALTGIRGEMEATIPGSGKIADAMKDLVNNMASDRGQKFLTNMGTALLNVGKALGVLSKVFVDILSNPQIENLIEWVAGHPVLSLTVGTFGLSLLKSTIVGAFNIGTAALVASLVTSASTFGLTAGTALTAVGAGASIAAGFLVGIAGVGVVIAGAIASSLAGSLAMEKTGTTVQKNAIESAGKVSVDAYQKRQLSRGGTALIQEGTKFGALATSGKMGALGAIAASPVMGFRMMGQAVQGKSITSIQASEIATMLLGEINAQKEKGAFFSSDYISGLEQARKGLSSQADVVSLHQQYGTGMTASQALRGLSREEAQALDRYKTSGQGLVTSGGQALNEEQKKALVTSWDTMSSQVQAMLVTKWGDVADFEKAKQEDAMNTMKESMQAMTVKHASAIDALVTASVDRFAAGLNIRAVFTGNLQPQMSAIGYPESRSADKVGFSS